MVSGADNSGGYRYGFNGKEKDDEIKGGGTSYDFGARIYDPRIGRFLSVDPLINKYPSFSPYVIAINNPIAMIDRDGEDAIVSIKKNADGSGAIKVQTVIHLKGPIESQRANAFNNYTKKQYADQKVDVEGKVWTIQYDIRYIYDEKFSESKMKSGDNVLTFDPATPMSGPMRTHVNPVNNKGLAAIEDRKYPEVIAHETGHFIGFQDQYTEIGPNHPGFNQYLRNKYSSKEDNAPGGKLYQLLKTLREDNVVIAVANEGYENNMMQNNQGGFTDEQNRALVNNVLKIADGKEGTFIMRGFFGTKGVPSAEKLSKAYEELEKKLIDKNKSETKSQ